MGNLSLREFFIITMFLLSAVLLTWGLMVKPNDYQWMENGETTAIIQTILPSQNLIGQTALTAMVTLDGGGKTIVTLPMNANFVEGREIPIVILKDGAGSRKTKYAYKIH